jgi:hypothetical protein
VLGTAGGGIDSGQWQLPMPQMISSGAITNGRKVPMYILAMLSSQGNGIVASNSVKKADLGLNTKGDGKFFKTFEKEKGRKFRAAYTFPKANQDMWIRYWLAAGGVDPDKNVELLTAPAAETVTGLHHGQPGNQPPDGTSVLEQPPGRCSPIPTRASRCGPCWSRCAGSSIPPSCPPSLPPKRSTTR